MVQIGNGQFIKEQFISEKWISTWRKEMKKRKIVLSCLLSLSFILGNMITPADAYSQNNVGDSVDGPEEAANDAYVHYDQDNCSWTF